MRIATEVEASVMRDLSVWDEEKARAGSPLIRWPVGSVPRDYAGLLVVLKTRMAEKVINAINDAHGAGTVPDDQSSFEVQWALRLAARAAEEIDLALRKRFGKEVTRVAFVNAFKKWIRECDTLAADALPTKAARSAARKAAGISKAAASRARTRGLKRSTF